MVIYKTVPVVIKSKQPHVHKVCGKLCRCTHKDYGDVPVGSLNGKNFIPVVNRRGLAYAARNRLKFRNKKIYRRKGRRSSI